MKGSPRTKGSHLAGTWYAGTARELSAQVDELLAAAAGEGADGDAAALVVPHAGYRYSGRAAAGAYLAARAGGARRVVVLAPSHYCGFHGLAVPDFEAFETPLGTVRIDTAAARAACRGPLVRADSGPFQQEHAVEIQLPLLQRVFPEAVVVPFLAGSLSEEDYRPVVGLLAPLLDANTIVVASSDFTHYGARFGYLPFPATDQATVKAKLASLDGGAVELVMRGDRAAFEDYVGRTGATICGRVPIACLLEMRAGRGGGRLLQYYTSLDVTGDYEHSVSYAAIAFPRG